MNYHSSTRTAAAPGVLWCGHCHRVGEPVDPGDAYPVCDRCAKRLIRRQVEQLPAAERDLRKLTAEGYHFCERCGHVTRLSEDRCVLCGADAANVTWQPPALEVAA